MKKMEWLVHHLAGRDQSYGNFRFPAHIKQLNYFNLSIIGTSPVQTLISYLCLFNTHIMIKKLFLSLCLLSLSVAGISQSFSIEGTLLGQANKAVYLIDFKGENRSIIDTVYTDMSGTFSIPMTEDMEKGMYLLGTPEGQMIELIFHNESIQFVASGSGEDQQVQIISSIENMIYYDYLYSKGAYLYKNELLHPIIQLYPADETFYQQALDTYRNNQEELKERLRSLGTENPGTLASRYIAADAPLFFDPTLEEAALNAFQKTHYFDQVDFNDSILIRGSILTSKIVDYLTLYQFGVNSQEELENQMLRAVDTIMLKAEIHQSVYEFVIDFVVNGFTSIGFDKGLEHIAQQSKLEQFCVNSERKKELESRLDLVRKLAVGKTAPAFETTSVSGENIVLNDIKAKKTILVFWASWCPHCDAILPVLKDWYAQYTREELEVVAISVDDHAADYNEALDTYNFDWINVGNLKGWDGPVIMAYGIAATPSIFILDENKSIIGKPNSVSQLNEMMAP